MVEKTMVCEAGGRMDGNTNPIPAFPHEYVLIAYHCDGIRYTWATTIGLTYFNFATAFNTKSVLLTKVHGRKDDGCEAG